MVCLSSPSLCRLNKLLQICMCVCMHAWVVWLPHRFHSLYFCNPHISLPSQQSSSHYLSMYRASTSTTTISEIDPSPIESRTSSQINANTSFCWDSGNYRQTTAKLKSLDQTFFKNRDRREGKRKMSSCGVTQKLNRCSCMSSCWNWKERRVGKNVNSKAEYLTSNVVQQWRWLKIGGNPSNRSQDMVPDINPLLEIHPSSSASVSNTCMMSTLSSP